MTAVYNKQAYQQLHSLLYSISDFSPIYKYLHAAVLLDKPALSQLGKKFPTFYGM
jgi:hypothetical protein